MIGEVNTNWKRFWPALLPALAFVLAGCGGVTMNKTISPIDILPYLIQADPPSTNRFVSPPLSEKLIAKSDVNQTAQ